MLNPTEFTFLSIIRDIIMSIIKRISRENKAIVKIFSVITVVLIPYFFNYTQTRIENIIIQTTAKNNLPSMQITDDHINITTHFWITANQVKLKILNTSKDIVILDIFANEMPSGVWVNDTDLRKMINFIRKQKQSDIIKEKKESTTIIRRQQHQELLNFQNYYAINFYEKDRDLDVITHKNLYLIKGSPIRYGIYSIIYNLKDKSIFYFIEEGGCQIQNYTLENRANLQTKLYFNTKAATVDEFKINQPLLYEIFVKYGKNKYI